MAQEKQWQAYYNHYGTYSQGDQSSENTSFPIKTIKLENPVSPISPSDRPSSADLHDEKPCLNKPNPATGTTQGLAQVRKEITNAGSLLNQNFTERSSPGYVVMPNANHYSQWHGQHKDGIVMNNFQYEYEKNSGGVTETEKQKAANVWVNGGQVGNSPDFHQRNFSDEMLAKSSIASRSGSSYIESSVVEQQYIKIPHIDTHINGQGHAYVKTSGVTTQFVNSCNLNPYRQQGNLQESFISSQRMDQRFVEQNRVYNNYSQPHTSIIKRELERDARITFSTTTPCNPDNYDVPRKIVKTHTQSSEMTNQIITESGRIKIETKVQEHTSTINTKGGKRIVKETHKVRFQKPKYQKAYPTVASIKQEQNKIAPPPFCCNDINPAEKIRLSFQNAKPWNVDHYYPITANMLRGTAFQQFDEWSSMKTEEQIIDEIQPVVEGKNFDPFIFLNRHTHLANDPEMTNQQVRTVYTHLLNGQLSSVQKPFPFPPLRVD